MIALLIVAVVGVAAFGEIAPKSLGGFVLAFLLSAAATFSIGLAIAARARTPELRAPWASRRSSR